MTLRDVVRAFSRRDFVGAGAWVGLGVMGAIQKRERFDAALPSHRDDFDEAACGVEAAADELATATAAAIERDGGAFGVYAAACGVKPADDAGVGGA